MIKIYNSLTKKKQDFKPVEGKKIKMYSCGVTVYDDCHIGHARSLYVFDVICRYLEFKGYKVNFVRNITDIDDKIINKAKQAGVGWKELSDRYIKLYRKDVENLGLRPVDFEPKATENIEDMIIYIKELIDKGYAYKTNSGVYFEVRKFKGYGKLSGQKIDDIASSGRIKSDENKRDPLDFALWKIVQLQEPGWDSPWGRGRPGWHIECSVMSQKYLKRNTLDIHGGGRDLIFPHHENEAAQAESLSGKNFANYWIHHGLLTIDSQKMSKSLGNFIKISDVLDKYPANALKLFYLQAHYSSSIDFSWQKMEEAQKAYQHIKISKERLENFLKNEKPKPPLSRPNSKIKNYKQNFIEAMDDDFNMPKGLAVLFDLVNRINGELAGEAKEKNKNLTYYRQALDQIASVFGFDFSKKKLEGITKGKVEELIAERNLYRNQKQFDKSDQIRSRLLEKGIILEDTKEGTVWRRK
ncbi:MAG: cysteine--tRNA ligase [Candidatus Omnitrophica bacterium]|nr:cysteine--tRNA ligase [Candidatus Omnitrophota bacterium]MCF7891583.1 cysteine--tRNA ligase [Candidatus Omnitrophota bacterium]MCF7896109.1 cysteine--tRNA ligase [Candidatus Omnitrophota bacterium]MCF7898087.1 cysteine--tRNA ligase [Candidatus Omnitrophota bacterium]MCF7909870.1 cysteine--tRNA ligase [Candidatus Omnitrophota bacterium]